MKNRIFNLYVNFICDECGITRKQFFTKSGKTMYSTPRFMLYYICNERPIRMTEIKRLMESYKFKVERANIEYGINKISKSKDKDVWRIINSCLIILREE
jgi:hypothetical protein|tara:strand:- start:454 stop:753 length:300 start_codon:yes stop_codon:yes gene_type:complete